MSSAAAAQRRTCRALAVASCPHVAAALLAALSAVVLAAILDPTTGVAAAPARVLAASVMAREVGHRGLYGPAPDRALVIAAWRDAGVDIRGLGTQDDLMHACTLLDASAPRPAGPAPADYVLYRDSAGGDRIGMLLSAVDLAIVEAGTVAVVPLPQLDALGDATVASVLAQPQSVHVCRLAPVRWPGGRDDTSVGVGRIALADPEHTAESIRWAADHPRDADTTLGHTLSRIVTSFVEGVTGVVRQVMAAIFGAAHRVLTWLGPAGLPLLLLGGVLGHTFDGRRLHAVLTGLVLAALGIALGLGWILPFGWVLAGALLAGAAGAGVHAPVLGAIGGALVGGAFAVASFLVGVLTGVDVSARVSVGTVFFSLAADVLWLRPAMAAFGVAMQHVPSAASIAGLLLHAEGLPALSQVAGDGRSLLDISSTAGDALALRPRALADAAHAMLTGPVAGADAGTAAARAIVVGPPIHHALTSGEALAAAGERGLDLVSLTWRPSSIASDLVGHAADAMQLLDTEMRSGLPSLPWIRDALLALEPGHRNAVLDAVAHVSTHAVPQMQIAARLSHLHSGARTLVGIASGENMHPAWWQAWRSPVVRHLLRGLPGRTPAM